MTFSDSVPAVVANFRDLRILQQKSTSIRGKVKLAICIWTCRMDGGTRPGGSEGSVGSDRNRIFGISSFLGRSPCFPPTTLGLEVGSPFMLLVSSSWSEQRSSSCAARLFFRNVLFQRLAGHGASMSHDCHRRSTCAFTPGVWAGQFPLLLSVQERDTSSQPLMHLRKNFFFTFLGIKWFQHCGHCVLDSGRAFPLEVAYIVGRLTHNGF